MADAYHHGIKVEEINGGSRPLRAVSSGVVGMVCTADDADAITFPLNVPVYVNDVLSAAGKAGDTGTLARSLEAIGAQTKPETVIVRVSAGATSAEATSNVIGGVSAAGQYTGLNALLAAETRLGVKPRILGVPGLDTIPVANALVAVAQRLRAMAYANAHECTTKEEATAYRAGFSARELMLIWPDFVNWNTSTNAADTIPSVATALGLRAKIDSETGWHKTLSNVGVNGVTGISRDVFFDLQDSSTDANYLNSKQVTTLIRRDGFRFWGSRTCSDDPLFAFESATRTAHIVAETIGNGMMWSSDKPLHPSLMRDIVEEINNELRALTREGKIIGASAWFDPDANPASQLIDGKAIVDYDYTPVPPLENLTLRQRITDRYMADFSSRMSA